MPAWIFIYVFVGLGSFGLLTATTQEDLKKKKTN